MSTFLEKNKKKSALAALLLFLRTRKTVVALLLLVAIASFLFVSPSNLLLSFPGGDRAAAGMAWLAGKVGVDTSKWGLAGGKRDYGDLLAAFHAAKDGSGKAGWAAFMRGGEAAEAGRLAAGSSGSLGFVKGNAKDLEAKGGSGENLAKPGSVEGVLNPDDDKNRGADEGVALSEGDVSGSREGMVKTAFAGGFGSGAGGSGAGGEAPGGAFASSGFFGGKGAASGKLGDVVKNGLDGISPKLGNNSLQVKGAAKGQLSAAKASRINARSAKGLVGSHTISGQRAFVQLAAGRGRAAISVSPNCSAGSGCPGEYAATNTGAVYDGNTISGDRTDILTAPHIDGISSPNLPDTGMADDYVKQAEDMDRDARKCQELDEFYAGTSTTAPHHNPTEIELDNRQKEMSKVFDSMGCGQGGCSKSKANACRRMGDQMKDLCRETMTIRCKHMRECPLTAPGAANCSPAECDGGARAKEHKTVVSDGIVSSTADDCMVSKDGENYVDPNRPTCAEGPGCAEAKRNVISNRETGRNAVTEYRTRDCVRLRQERDAETANWIIRPAHMKYSTECSGPEDQVVNTCKSYANSLCSRARNCSSVECTPDTSECVITDLDGIEEFFNSQEKY